MSLQLLVTNPQQFHLSPAAPSKQVSVSDTALVIPTTGPKSSCEKGTISTPLLVWQEKNWTAYPAS